MIKKLYNYWFGPSLRVYIALPITGLSGKQIWDQYYEQKVLARKYGIVAVSPVPGEGILANSRKVSNRKGKVADEIWDKDKKQIRDQQGFIFPLNGQRSIGCIAELVKARGTHWKITAVVTKRPDSFIAIRQYDIVVASQKEAFKQLAKRFLTRHQRAMHRIKFIWKIPRDVYWKIREFWL